MEWHRLAFLHWPLPPAALADTLPPGLELDTFDGAAWIGIVPFEMRQVRLHGLPAAPGLSDFPELNVRTYVTHGEKPGVFFYSLDAGSRVAVEVARRAFHLPYFNAAMSVRGGASGVAYRSRRTDGRGPPGVFEAEYGPVATSASGTGAASDPLERFLTERYCLYAADDGRIWRSEVHHDLWPLRPGRADLKQFDLMRLTEAELPDSPPLVHYAERLNVVAWAPEELP